MWEAFVDVVRATIFAGSHLFNGSLGASVVVVSTLARLAILPLVLRAARHARANQAKLLALKPQTDRLQKRFKDDRRRLMVETQELYRKNDIQLVGGSGLASFAIQVPLLGALFAAVRDGLGARVRFLWIADLARPDASLMALVVALTGVATIIAPVAPGSPIGARVMTAVIMGGTLIFLASASSAVALSVGAGSAVSLLQNWMIRRDAIRNVS
jgi:YidC/Oxa1 family membrane protein insertase